MDDDQNSDPSQQNPGLWEYVKQKLAQANSLQPNPVIQKGLDQGNQLAAGTVGAPEAQLGAAVAEEAAPAVNGLLGRSAYTQAAPQVVEQAANIASPAEQALTKMSNPMSEEATAGMNQTDVGRAVDTNSRNVDFQARNAKALADKKAKALAVGRKQMGK